MVRSRTGTAIVGLAVSLLLSAIGWWYFDTLLLFLFVPFVPFLFRGGEPDRPHRRVRRCPTCGFETTNGAYEYCPRDGTALS